MVSLLVLQGKPTGAKSADIPASYCAVLVVFIGNIGINKKS
jgi:hypothetical protein